MVVASLSFNTLIFFGDVCSELSSLFQFNLQEQRQLHLLQSQRLELEAEVRTPNFEAFML